MTISDIEDINLLPSMYCVVKLKLSNLPNLIQLPSTPRVEFITLDSLPKVKRLPIKFNQLKMLTICNLVSLKTISDIPTHCKVSLMNIPNVD